MRTSTNEKQDRKLAGDVEALTRALADPFDPSEVKFKPAVVSGNRAMAIAYVDARVIQDRLDDVLGVAGWQDEYECLPDGNVVCRLRLHLGGQWITKMDVGGPSEQPDEGDRRKAALLKKFGSVQRMRLATVEQIAEVPGFGGKAAAELKAFLEARTASPASEPSVD